MPLVYKNNYNKSTSIAVWRKEENYSYLKNHTLLTEEDCKNLQETKLEKRRCEKLLTRKVIQEILPDFGQLNTWGFLN